MIALSTTLPIVDWQVLSRTSDVLGIIGFVISLITLLRVWKIRKAIASQSLFKSIHQALEDALKFPTAKATLTSTNATKVESIVWYLDSLVVSSWRPKHHHARKIIKKIKTELKGTKRTVPILEDLSILKDQLFNYN
jgi:hypothetical protein